MEPDSDLFLSSFRIECTEENWKGWLVPCERKTVPLECWARITEYTNSQGRFYEESHLEEWVARCPRSIFPDQHVIVLASQNYAHLPEKIDLLTLSSTWRFSVVEAKIGDVAKNCGTTPYCIHITQMRRYVQFLQSYLRPFPGRLVQYYQRFSERFFGQSRRLEGDLLRAFGADFLGRDRESQLQEVYLVHNYDDHAIDYFKSQTVTLVDSIRLVYFRFDPADAYIEFRERLLC